MGDPLIDCLLLPAVAVLQFPDLSDVPQGQYPPASDERVSEWRQKTR